MKKIILLLCILLAVSLQNTKSQNAPVATLDSIVSYGIVETVSVRVTGFVNIMSFNLKLLYNSSKVTATNVVLNPALGGSLDVVLTTPGVITLGWFTTPADTLPDDAILFTITFNKGTGGKSPITWNDDGYSCQYYDGNFVVLNDLPTSTYYKNGSITFITPEAPVTTAPTMAACSGTNIAVPVTVANFNSIGGVSLTLHYNSSVLTYQSSVNTSGFPGLSIIGSLPGTVVAGGYIPTSNPGVTLDDNDTLFMIYFNYLGGSTDLTWYDDGESCDYQGPPLAYVTLNDTPTASYYINGVISQINLPDPAGTITGSSGVCLGQTGVSYSVAAITGATSYIWNYDGTGATINGITNSITIDFSNTATAGNLTVKGENLCGEGTVSPDYLVTVNPLPAAVAGTDRAICLGESTQIGADAVPGSTYSWTSLPTGFTSTLANPTVNPAVTTTYSVVETITATGCTNTHSVVVTVNPLPAAGAGADRAICTGASTQIGAAPVAGSTYSWTSLPVGFTSTLANPTVSPAVATTYTVVETITATGCTNTHSVIVSINPLPAAVAGTDRAICLGESTQIGAAAVTGSTYSWTSAPAGFTSALPNPTVSPAVTTTYTVVEIITATGCSNTHSVIVTVNPLPAAVAGTDRAICIGGSTQIGAAAVTGNTYSWTSLPVGFTSTEANPSVSPVVATTYTLIETITATGCTNTHSVIITITDLPAAVAGANRTICLGTSTQIGAAAVTGSTYSWTSVPAGFTSTVADPTVSPLVTTTYTVTETITAGGCSNSNSVTVTVDPLPAAVAGTDRAICPGEITQIGAADVSGSTYSWTSAPAGFTSTLANPTVSPAVTTTYTVVETITATGCTNTHSVMVTINPLPAAVAGADRAICLGASTQLGADAVAGSTYSWTSDPAGFTSTLANPTVSPAVITTYAVVETITATGCTNTHSVIVTINPLPAAVAGADRAICLGASTQIGADAVTGSTYSWISVPAGFTSTLANPTVSPVVTTTYTVEETITATGCTNTHSVIITVNPLPAAVAGADRAICLGASTQIGATAVTGSTYSWTSVPAGFTSTLANPTVSPAVTTTYTVVETITLTGCTNTHSVIVTVNPLPAAVAGADRAICLGASTQIGAAAVLGNTYSWTSLPVGFTSTEANPTVSPAVTTTYTVVETITATGCTNTHSIIVTVNTLPAAVAGADRAICLGASTQIGAAAVTGSTYSWTSLLAGFASILANPTVSPVVTTTYTVVETITATGCTNTHSVIVTVNPLPAAVAGADRAICLGASTQIGAAAVTGSTYSWTSLPAGFTSAEANPTVSPAVTTTYTVVETITATACTNTHSVIVTVNPLPAAVAGADRPICLGASTQIGAAAVTGSTYSWTSVPAGFTSTLANPTVSPVVTTTYIVVETITATGCTNTHSVIVTVNQLPAAIAGADRAICLGAGTQIGAAAVAGSTYSWTSVPAGFASTLANPTVNPGVTTTFTVVETNTATGCTNTHSVIVTVNSLPAAVAGADRAICLGTSTQIGAAAVAGSTYSWTSVPAGFTSTLANPTVSPLVTTIYTVIETITLSGCSNTHSVIISINPLPLANAGPDQSIPNGTSTTLSGSASGGQGPYKWLWSPADKLSTSDTIPNPVTVNLNSSTVYTLVVTDNLMCQSTPDQVTIHITGAPLSVVVTATPPTVIIGQSTQLLALVTGGSGTYTYSWSSTPPGFSSTIVNPVVTPTTSTTYYVAVFDGFNTAYSNFVVIVLFPPIVTWENTLTDQCVSSTTYALTGGEPEGGTYSGPGVEGSNFNATLAGAGTHTLTYSYQAPNFLISSATNSIIVHSLPVVTWNNALTAQCVNTSSYALTGGTPGGGVYSGIGVSGSNFNASIAGVGTHILTYTYLDANGCENFATNTIEVLPLPATPGPITGDLQVCQGQSGVTYSVEPVANAITYAWEFPAGATIVSGAGTNTVVVDFSDIAVGGFIRINGVNNCGSGPVSSTTLIIDNKPIVDAGLTVTIMYGFSTVLNGSVVNGLAPYSYDWSPAYRLSNTAILNPVADPRVTTHYHLMVTDANGCVGQDTVTVFVGSPFMSTITGQVTYNNAQAFPIPDAMVTLEQDDTVRYSGNTDPNGYYSLNGVLPGIYKLNAVKAGDWGGVNATDAMLIAWYFVEALELSDIQKNASDVNASGNINSLDAQTNLRRFVAQIYSFPAGDWAFDSITIAVTGNGNHDLKALNMGDVNGSRHFLAKSKPAVEIIENGIMEVASNDKIELPIYAGQDLELGSVSLVLNYPKELLEFIDLKCAINQGNFIFNEDNGEIRIGWFDISAFVVKKGTELFTVKIKLRNPDQSIPEGLLLTVGAESVIADPFAQEMEMVTLLIPKLVKAKPGEEPSLLLDISPNPFSDNTKLHIKTNCIGVLQFRIYNVSGELLNAPIIKEIPAAGIYDVEFDGSALPQGIYWYTADFKGFNTITANSGKLIIIR